jgi:hypothetical protein
MKLDEFWHRIDPGLKFSIAAYLVARVALTVWSLIIFIIFPTVTQNLDLFGTPILTALNLQTSERFAYSRTVGNTVLSFRADDPGFVRDVQTGSKWTLRDGRAIEGELMGQSLGAANYSVEEIFPYHGVEPESNVLLALWQRFDTNWYLSIAAHGYADKASTVYLPLYPLLIHGVGMITPSAMGSAMLVSNLALVGALVVLYRIAKMFSDDAGAKRAVAFLLLFPTAFFLSIAYTESLFLLLTLSAFYAALRERWLWAMVLGVLAALTRLQGVLLLVPLGWMLWQQYRASRATDRTLRFARGGLLLLAIPFATFTFLVFTNLSLLNAYEGELHARFVLPWENIAALLNLLMSAQASFVDILNLVATAGAGVMIFALWKKLPGEYMFYSIAMWLAPLFRMTTTQPLVSMARYTLALFPMFMLLGLWGKNAWVNRAVVYLSFPLQLYLSAQFILWGWVG